MALAVMTSLPRLGLISMPVFSHMEEKRWAVVTHQAPSLATDCAPWSSALEAGSSIVPFDGG